MNPGHWSSSFQTFGVEGPRRVEVWAWKDDRLLADEVFDVMVLIEGWSDIDINIVSPRSGEKVEGILLANGTATSNYTLKEVSVRIDEDGPWQIAKGLANWTVALDTHNLTDGKHKLWVRASDEYRTGETSVDFMLGEEMTAGTSSIDVLEAIALVALIVILVALLRSKPPRVSEKASGH